MNEHAGSKLKRLLRAIGQRTIQDVPPELYACEMCRRTACSDGEWIVCERRIAHVQYLEEHQDTTRS